MRLTAVTAFAALLCATCSSVQSAARDHVAFAVNALDQVFPPGDPDAPRVEDCGRFWSVRLPDDYGWKNETWQQGFTFALERICDEHAPGRRNVETEQQTGVVRMSSDPGLHIEWLAINETPAVERRLEAFQSWRDGLGREATEEDVIARWPEQRFGPSARVAAAQRLADLLPAVEACAGNNLKITSLRNNNGDRRTFGWIAQYEPSSSGTIECTASIDGFDGALLEIGCGARHRPDV